MLHEALKKEPVAGLPLRGSVHSRQVNSLSLRGKSTFDVAISIKPVLMDFKILLHFVSTFSNVLQMQCENKREIVNEVCNYTSTES